MRQEVKNLLHRLLWSIVENGKAGISNAFQDLNEVMAELEFDYAIRALKELKNLEEGRNVNFNNVAGALDDCTEGCGDDTTKEKIETMLDYGYSVAIKDFSDLEERRDKEKELKEMYYPCDELVSELAKLIDGVE